MTKCYVRTHVTCYCFGNAIEELCNLTKNQPQVLNPLLSSSASTSEGNQLTQDLQGGMIQLAVWWHAEGEF